MIEPLMDHVMHDERITLLTGAEVTNLRGFFGNFEVTLKVRARYVDPEACMGCGLCSDPCPVSAPNRHDGNLSVRHAIFTPFPGALPNAPAIDPDLCLRTRGGECSACREACFLGAIDLDQQDQERKVEVGAIVVATGFGLYDASAIGSLCASTPDVLDAYQFERMVAREGSTKGQVLTSRGTTPQSIAFIHCVGSRDPRH
jgi:heterodisulfide reductase subunit A